jgi:hypothetical protein
LNRSDADPLRARLRSVAAATAAAAGTAVATAAVVAASPLALLLLVLTVVATCYSIYSVDHIQLLASQSTVLEHPARSVCVLLNLAP